MKTKKIALITGINGQDGSYLAASLNAKGYEVHGTIRESSFEDVDKIYNIKDIMNEITLHVCNIEDHLTVYKLISEIKPDECYHLAASSFVSYSFDHIASMTSINFNSTNYLLSSIRELKPDCRLYFAGSSEMFGDPDVSPQMETTRFNPRSIYGISKLSSYHIVKSYREQYGLYFCTGIAYNHESPHRDHIFVTRKISSGIARIHLGMKRKLELGNIEAIRDWGYAPEYVEAMWKILNNPSGPKDYVISTGISRSVKEFLDIAFSVVDLDYEKYVEINPKFFRPSERINLVGDSSLIKEELGWEATKPFEEIIEEMVHNDIILLEGNI